MEILYMKNTINKMNISVKALNSKMEVTEEQIYKKDDRAIELCNLTNRQNIDWKKNEQNLRSCCTIRKDLTFQERRKKSELKKLSKK